MCGWLLCFSEATLAVNPNVDLCQQEMKIWIKKKKIERGYLSYVLSSKASIVSLVA